MSDLISRLAARVTDPHAVRATPRPVPRFARDTTASEATPSDTPLDDDAVTDDARPTASRGPGRHEPRTVPRPDTTTQLAASPTPDTAAAAGPTGTPDNAGDGDRPPVESRPSRGPGHARPPHSPRSAPTAGRPDPADPDRHEGDHPGGRTRGRKAAVIADPPSTDTTATPPRGDDSPTAVVARPGPTPTRPEPAQSPQEPPVIRVRIDRLEVRATPDPAPTRRHRTDPSPDTTLAEYLRAHRGSR